MLVDDVTRELRSLYEQPATNIVDEINFRLSARGRQKVGPKEIVEVIATPDSNSPAVIEFHKALAFWDASSDARFKGKPGSEEKRREVLSVLGLQDFESKINDVYPIPGGRHYVISSDQKWTQWYSPSMGNKFYWENYKKILTSKGYESVEIEQLSASVDDIMRRISSPFSIDPYQSKGLVVGHVQSGKTSHFTGLIAKAISSGYKLIIVLTGTTELLRAQTQRRLDMELIGKENILNGRYESDIELLIDVDYVLDPSDWDNFVSFGKSIAEDPLVPEILRLTTYKSDFKSLKQGLDALDFQKDRKRRGLPIFDRENLDGMPVRFLVLKKNSKTLQKVIKDLKSIHTNLQEVPALIIDDEADQASPNTKRNSISLDPSDDKKKERTAINRHISTLLKIMPRAQYVGYTATPFANVFIEPDDYEDIFPKDFIVSLEPSKHYLGSRHFHDIDLDLDRDVTSMATSNEAAFARRVYATDDEAEVRELGRALDAFVLTGAIKLFRASRGKAGDFKHHTMLAHTSMYKESHRSLKALVDKAWNESAYHNPKSVQRLWELLQSDFFALDQARNWGGTFPEQPEILADCIGEALALIERHGSPAVIVNSDDDLDSRELNFRDSREWRIVIGGAMLSRGFTVEGLTISYFRRRTNTQDALMQMGRWFGYRPGYGDLVRLFIGADEKHNSREIDLYDAFTATVRDEEEFRAALQIYAELSNEDGSPQVTPAEIPPLVYQQLGWLRPTSRNKMFNAVLTHEGYSEKFIEKARHLPFEESINAFNFALFESHILNQLTEEDNFKNLDGNLIKAMYGIVSARSMFEFTNKFKYSGDTLKPTAAFIDKSIDNGTIKDFFVMIHLPKSSKYCSLAESGKSLPVIRRRRREGLGGGRFVGTERRNRKPLEVISGRLEQVNDELAKALRSPTRASMLIEVVGEEAFWTSESPVLDPSKVAILFGFVFPFGSAPHKGRIAFQTRQTIVESNE